MTTGLPIHGWEELVGYEKSRWGKPATARWLSLCLALRDYVASDTSFTIGSERKWELVSALQKSVRRGEKEVALRLVSAMTSLPSEALYFWRRLCVIACEDIGLADDLLVSFVVACATIFSPRICGESTRIIWPFLVERMCSLPARSRIYCSLSLIEPVVTEGEQLTQLVPHDLQIFTIINQRLALLKSPKNPWTRWLKKNDWRAEGLLRYLTTRLPFEIEISKEPLTQAQSLLQLPNYSYDMHTRVGIAVLQRLVRGVAGAEELQAVITRNAFECPYRTLGAALFFVEGGRISSELRYEPLISLEQRVFAHRHRIPLSVWTYLQKLISGALNDGIIDQLRQEELDARYHCN